MSSREDEMSSREDEMSSREDEMSSGEDEMSSGEDEMSSGEEDPTALDDEARDEPGADPLRSQGLGEQEDFGSRDYVIPGVEADDPDPYRWHTGKKRDHGGEDA